MLCMQARSLHDVGLPLCLNSCDVQIIHRYIVHAHPFTPVLTHRLSLSCYASLSISLSLSLSPSPPPPHGRKMRNHICQVIDLTCRSTHDDELDVHVAVNLDADVMQKRQRVGKFVC